MSGWQTTALGEFIEVKHGYAFKGAGFGTGGTHRLVTPGNFYERGGFRDRGPSQKSYDGPVPDDYVLSPGSLVVAMTEQAPGLLGSSGRVPDDRQVWLHNQRIGLVTVRNQAADQGFLYYLFNEPSVRAQINATATGAKVRHTAPGRIQAVRAAMPSLPTQRRIAAALSAFDELIEINERRIELLENLARSLYREWFVRFRFPGHEDVDLVDSELGPIPEGWVAARLSDFVTTQYGLTASSSEHQVGPNFLRGMDINKRSYVNWANVPYCVADEEERERFGLEVGDICVIRMADPGKVGIVERPVQAVFASYLARILQ